MNERYEIRVSEAIYSAKYVWKLMKCSYTDEEIITIGYEDTLDLAYEQAKKVYEKFAK